MRALTNLMLSARLWRALFFLLLVAVLYLTLKPNPQIAEVAVMPQTMADFFDLHDDWKNVVGFGALALAGFLGWPGGWGPVSWTERARRRLLFVALFSAVGWMEFFQLFIPTRFADPKDLVAGGLGTLLAWLASWAVRRWD
jgi:hypothetical protein